MHSKPHPDNDLEAYVVDSNWMVPAGSARRVCNAPLTAWLTTVVLVLIVIAAALSLAAWRAEKHSENPGMQTGLASGFRDSVPLVAAGDRNP